MKSCTNALAVSQQMHDSDGLIQLARVCSLQPRETWQSAALSRQGCLTKKKVDGSSLSAVIEEACLLLTC